MKRSLTLLAALFAVTAAASAARDKTVISINDEKIPLSELKYYYEKNSSLPVEHPTVEDYAGMFIDFRLKVRQAKDLQYDTVPAYRAEIGRYRSQLAAPYLTDDSMRNELMRREYERLGEEIDLCHIMLRINEPDTTRTYARAMALYERLQKGEDFAALAREASDDRYTAEKGGRVGWITAMNLVYQLENAAYACPTDSFLPPVRSPYGYHIVKVNGRRPTKGEILTAHILLRNPRPGVPGSADTIREDAEALLRQARAGENFEQLVKTYSQDEATISKGGELPWLGVGHANRDFDDAAFALENPGDMTICEAPYGFHVIKLLDKRPIAGFEESKDRLDGVLSQRECKRLIDESFLNRLKKEYKLKYGKGDVVCSFADTVLRKSDYEDFLKKNPYVKDSLKAFVDQALRRYEDSHLEQKYPEFGMLMKEYRDGVLLFNISSDSVWNKASADREGQKRYFEEHRADYDWDAPRYRGSIIYCKTADVKARAEKLIAETPADSLAEAIRKEFNSGAEINARLIGEKLYIKGSNPIIDYYGYGMGDKPEIKNFEEAIVIGRDLGLKPESYLDVKGSVINDYQKYLEARWLERLRKSYDVKLHYNVLKTLK